MNRRTLLRVALGAAALSTLTVAAAAGWAWTTLHASYAGWADQAVEVVLEPGMSAEAMIERLAAAGVLQHPRLVRAWASWSGSGGLLQAGEYRFDTASSSVAVIERLRRGEVLLHQVTLREGLNLGEIASRLADGGFGNAEELRQVFGDPGPVADLDPEAVDLEGYLFPDTYRFPRGAAAEEIAATLVQRFRDVVGPDYAERARAVGLDLPGAVKLASMIEKETSVPRERARISRVFHNRLDRGMRLECDPTVRYALERAGRPVERLLYEHLQFESPWNTYRVYGLPAGPIASAGRASLDAAVEPAAGDELYFVAAPDGGHRFSGSLSEHRKAVAEWRNYVRSSR